MVLHNPNVVDSHSVTKNLRSDNFLSQPRPLLALYNLKSSLAMGNGVLLQP